MVFKAPGRFSHLLAPRRGARGGGLCDGTGVSVLGHLSQSREAVATVPLPHITLVASTNRTVPTRSAVPHLLALSTDSLIFRSEELLAKGDVVRVTLRFRDLGTELEFEAEVVWTVTQFGDMALRFSAIDDEGLAAIQGYQLQRARHR